MEAFKELLALLLLFVIIALAGLFPAYVVMDISDAFRVPIFDTMKFYQVYGTILVARLILKTKVKRGSQKPVAEVYSDTFKKITFSYLSILVTWGLAYIILAILR